MRKAPDITGAFDPRVTPARADLAAASLRGRVDAPRYVAGRRAAVVAARAALMSAPEAGRGMATELLRGETFTIYDEQDGWAWGQGERDGYVGFVAAGALGPASEPTHWVSALSSHVYDEPGFKLPPRDALYFTSLVTVAGPAEKRFLPLAGGGWVYGRHLTPLGDYQCDHMAVAERFIGLPYLWGGRTAAGIDCSGLVQAALYALGRPCPRDSDQQAATVGRPLPEDAVLRRGDILFFPGHVGFMVDGTRLLHANATHMAVSVDPLDDVIEIVARSEQQPVTVRRRLE